MSFEQLPKKKQPGASSVSSTPKAAMSPKALPGKPPSQAPKTGVQDLKKFVHADKKAETTGAVPKKTAEKATLSKPKIVPELKDKEIAKPVPHEATHIAQQKIGHKGKDEES